MLSPRRDSDTTAAAFGVGAMIVAVLCCAGLPAIGALAGGLALDALIGVAGGALLLVGAAAVVTLLIVSRLRRRRQRRP